jgi:pimeloyl-ACP methyl ester carboxylesterase
MKWLFALIATLLLAGSAPLAAQAPFRPTRFSVEVVGSGPDVILIPGLTASKEVWRPTLAALPGYRYHLVQVAGFAGAPARGNARGDVVAPLAEEVARYIEAARLVKPALVGHSMGGTVATMVAARHPDRVGRVMAVDILPQPAGLLGGRAADLRGIAGLLRGLGATEEGRGLIDSAIRLFGDDQAANTRSDPDVVARATHDLAVTDLTPELPRIRAPFTVVYAVADPVYAASTGRTYAAAYARARGVRLVPVEGSGHMIMRDQPKRFVEALRAFLPPQR